jgi:beta-lactamase regulating signal transducer with metallopeptidase domain
MIDLGTFLSSEFIRAFGWTLLHSLWQGLALFLVGIVILSLLRRRSPQARYMTLFGLMSMIPLAFVVTFSIIYPTGESETVRSLYPQGAVPMPGEPDASSQLSTSGSLSTAWYGPVVNFLDDHTQWLFVLWFAGFLFFLVRFTGSLLYINRLRYTNLVDSPESWKSKLKELSGRLGIARTIRLAESRLTIVPVTVGYLKPVILLPLGTFSGVPPQMIDAILLHELAHIQRRDYLFNLVQSLIEMLFFFHPVTWWLSGQIRAEREHICDDLALSIHHDRINYIKALTTMEELNFKTPVLANAMTGPRKKLLHRIKRLVHPEQFNRGFAEGIVGFLMLALIAVAISANAFTFAGDEDNITEPTEAGLTLLTAYDLSGRESYENTTNYLPLSFSTQSPKTIEDESKGIVPEEMPGEPDTIIAKSGSGKVKVMVYTDTVKEGDQKQLQIMVETFEDQIEDTEKDRQEIEREVILLKREGERMDSLRKVIVIKSGDSVKVISNGRTIVLPEGMDTTIVTEGGFQLYGFGDYPAVPEIPGMPEMPELEHFYFGDNDLKWTEEYDEAMKEYQFRWQEFDAQQQEAVKDQQEEMERLMQQRHVYVHPPDEPFPPMEWYGAPPQLPGHSTEKIIRQELREDGLVEQGKSYIVEISSKAMYINGVKQTKEISKKYMHLVEGLEQGMLDSNGYFKVVF